MDRFTCDLKSLAAALGMIVAAVLIWVVMKILKLVLWVLIASVLIVGLGTATWLLVK